ncbi:MAG TPA: hypothetical protein VEC37_10900, partial [Bacillota bacterium]|nr:hypothetical protein [Bacillota bacterium]
MPLDFFWASDQNVEVNNNRVHRWTALNGRAFLEMPEALFQPVYKPNGLNHFPSLLFSFHSL